MHLLARGGTKTVKVYVAGSRRYHVSSINRVDGYLVAHHLKVQHTVCATAHNVKVGYGALRPAQFGHDAVAVHLHTGYGHTINSNDAVAGQHPRTLARAFAYNLQHHEGILHHIKTHANALKVATERFVQLFGILGIGVRRVRVEFAEHAVNGVLGQFLLVHTVNIEAGDGHLCHLQFFDLLKVHIAKARLCAGGQCEQNG